MREGRGGGRGCVVGEAVLSWGSSGGSLGGGRRGERG